jgi:nucleoid DNA-binding protein
MTKQDVLKQICQRTGQDSSTSRSVLESFFEVVKHQVAAGKSIQVRGFGSFVPVQRGAKVARNIGQKTALPIEAQVIPMFKPSAEFKEQVRAQPANTVKHL